MKASVIIGTYNHEEFLRRTLVGLTRQTEMDFETLICDDGSGPEIKKIAEEFVSRLPGAVVHCWQQDKGFRKCRVLNEGVLSARSDYLIFLDADCIPHHHFVEQHLQARKPGSYLVGRRVLLGESITSELSEEKVLSGDIERVFKTGLPGLFKGDVRHFEAGIYLSSWLGSLRYIGPQHIKGCNFSCWKSDLERINGFNEDFISCGGGEDDDVERRFNKLGLNVRSVRNAAICYHQYHKLVERNGESEALCNKLAVEGNIICANGLKEHSVDR